MQRSRHSTCVRVVHHLINTLQLLASLLHTLRNFTEKFVDLKHQMSGQKTLRLPVHGCNAAHLGGVLGDLA